MSPKYEALLRNIMSPDSFGKLAALKNPWLRILSDFRRTLRPQIDLRLRRQRKRCPIRSGSGLGQGEESDWPSGPDYHWDGYCDQGRDKNGTRFMVYKENLADMGALNTIEYEKGYAEIMDISRGIMKGKDAILQFFSEGPTESPFTIPCVQFTDSWYVAHSEFILYRSAYHHFLGMKEGEKSRFFRFIHSAGALDERNCTDNLDQRRIYMDTQNNIVYSMNNQYAGNSVGLKKHSMRLAINKAGKEGWLCEHMFIMAALDREKGRKTYFCGAYPSACARPPPP
jgi:phosphoenolpyruvate carboxykinase (GTP)